MLEMCPYGAYVLLGSLKHVLRRHKLTKNALKELKVNDEYVQRCAVNAITMSLSCVRVSADSVCKRLLLLTVDVKFLGSWKNFVLANTVAPNAGGTELASWDELFKCMWCIFLLVFTKKSKFHYLEGSLKFVTEGSLPWRF